MSVSSVQRVVDLVGLQSLVDVLWQRGFTVLGPTVRDAAVVHAEVRSLDDLPRGWGDEQDAAHYRLRRRHDDALFGFATSAQSWKPLLFPSRSLVSRGQAHGGGVTTEAPEPDERTYALLGVRSCDLRAIAVQDAVLRDRVPADPDYTARRERIFVIALTCSDPAGTCFCVSMGSGPKPDSGYDLALAELYDDGEHRFVVTVGSERGADVLDAVPTREVTDHDARRADDVAEQAAARMGRTLDTDGIKDLLYANAEHPRWDDVAERCLSCTSCTLVCPTCFCTSVDDVTDLTGRSAERWRVWDSCFTSDFSYLHGGAVRESTRSRYRQWATHKLASWIDQFGTSGCVGCGRCVTWCPAAIDLTEEVAAIRANPVTVVDDAREGPP